MDLSGVKKIIICSPGNVLVSGGVNSLHNLCRALMTNGYNAYMYYLDVDESIVNHEYYKAYNTNRIDTIKDIPENLIITSETLTPYLLQFSKAKKMVYWLGLTLFFKTPSWRFPFTIKLFRKLVECRSYDGYSSGCIENLKRSLYKYAKSHLRLWDGDVLHLSNSHFVAEYCRKKGVPASVLHNPIRDEFYERVGGEGMRENIILFGPKTKRKYMRAAKRRLPEYQMVKLKRLPSEEVFTLFTKAKLFVEFGNFSGRDRMPREAAILGCVVMVNTRGTASSQEDYNLPLEYKIADTRKNKQLITDQIFDCTLNNKKHYGLQKEFRQQLDNENLHFTKMVNRIFKTPDNKIS